MNETKRQRQWDVMEAEGALKRAARLVDKRVGAFRDREQWGPLMDAIAELHDALQMLDRARASTDNPENENDQ